MIHKAKSRSLRGATLVEFVMGFPLIILLIVFLVDTGLYLYQRSLLTDGTAAMTRQIVTALGQREADSGIPATPVPSAASCANLIIQAQKTYNTVKTANSNLYAGMSFSLAMTTAGVIPYRLVSLQGTNTFNCILCKFFAPNLQIQHTSVLVIERPVTGICATILSTCVSDSGIEPVTCPSQDIS